jgi:hypothetical protein
MIEYRRLQFRVWVLVKMEKTLVVETFWIAFRPISREAGIVSDSEEPVRSSSVWKAEIYGVSARRANIIAIFHQTIFNRSEDGLAKGWLRSNVGQGIETRADPSVTRPVSVGLMVAHTC